MLFSIVKSFLFIEKSFFNIIFNKTDSEQVL